MIVRFAVFEAVPIFTEIVAVVFTSMEVVSIEKAALRLPAGITTVVSGIACVLLLVIVTVMSLDDTESSVTIPIEVSPPVTLVGFSVNEASPPAGRTDRLADFVLVPSVALIATEAEVVTAFVLTTKEVLVLPALIVTEPVTVAAPVLALLRAITRPPTGALVVSVTTPIDDAIPPTTELGVSVIALIVAVVEGER